MPHHNADPRTCIASIYTTQGIGLSFFDNHPTPVSSVKVYISSPPAGHVVNIVMAWEDYLGSASLTGTSGALVVDTYYMSSPIAGANSTWGGYPYAAYTATYLTYTVTGSEPTDGNGPYLTFTWNQGWTFFCWAAFTLNDGAAPTYLGVAPAGTVTGSAITDEGNVLVAVPIGHSDTDTAGGYQYSDADAGMQSVDSVELSGSGNLTDAIFAASRVATSNPSYPGEIPLAGEPLEAIISSGGSEASPCFLFAFHRDPVDFVFDDPTLEATFVAP